MNQNKSIAQRIAYYLRKVDQKGPVHPAKAQPYFLHIPSPKTFSI